MHRLGIVDLGSNTARLVVYVYKPGRWFRLEDEIREPIRLAEGMSHNGRLSRPALKRAAAALELFADYRAASGLERLEVLGTSALRDAANREEFFQRIAPLGLEISVLSGEQEAAHGVHAVANSFGLENAWVLDLGGGSAQVSLMEGRRFSGGRAYPLGAVRLTERFLASDPPKRSEVRALEAELRLHLEPAAAAMRQRPGPVVAMGGTIRNLARVAQKQHGYPLNLLHGYFLRRQELESVVNQLLKSTVKQRAAISGIHPDRADIILAGALVFRWLLRQSQREGLWVSGQGVREGAFYQHLLPEPPHLIPNLRAFSLGNFAAHYPTLPDVPETDPHVEHVRRLSAQLFHGLQPLHRLGAEAAELLDAAALLHDVGTVVDYYHHHKHGAYLLGSAPLSGYSHREQVLLMLLMRYHQKGLPKLGTYEPLMHPGDKEMLRQLTTCLRLAECLERSRAGRVRGVEAIIGADRVTLELRATSEPSVELWETRNQAQLFRQAFGRKLVLETVPG